MMLTAEEAARAERVHREAYVIDAACPLVNPKEIGKQLDALRRGGVTCAVGTVASIEGSQETLHAIAAWFPKFRERPDDLCLATTTAEIESAKRSGRVAVGVAVLGGGPPEDKANLFGGVFPPRGRGDYPTSHKRKPPRARSTERNDA